MFLIKKLVSRMLFPVPLCLEFLIIGLLLVRFTRWKKTGNVLLVSGVVLLIVISSGILVDPLLSPLENKYPQVSISLAREQNVSWIVVLGGGHVPDRTKSITDQLGRSSLYRVVEGVRLAKNLPDARVIFSGGNVGDTVSDAEIMGRVALTMGLNPLRMVLEGDSRDTEEQAYRIKQFVGEAPLLLVTSASHMPRAMALFKTRGLKPIAAPTDFRTFDLETRNSWSLFPSGGKIYLLEKAIYERMGMIWARLRGKVTL